MIDVIVLGGGQGTRTDLPYNKVLHELKGKAIIRHAVEPFLKHDRIHNIIVVAAKDDVPRFRALFPEKNVLVVKGGKTRNESVQEGLKAIETEHVIIHDGARPLVPEALIDNVSGALNHHDAITCAIPLHDTIKRVKDKKVLSDIDRKGVYRIQTPQGFRTALLREAYSRYESDDGSFTCDATLVQHLTGNAAVVVTGDERNIKFTTMEDQKLMELMLGCIK